MGGDTNGRPIRVLRVIARLNVGGPALHVTYLARGLAERGYETTLVAGDVGRGEESMAFVAGPRGRRGRPAARAVARALAGPRRGRRVAARADHPDGPAGHRPHPHREGRRGRARRRRSSRGRADPSSSTRSTGTSSAAYFGRAGTLVFRAIETVLARVTDRLVAVSPEVRDELVALGVAPAEQFSVIRLGIELEPRVAFDGDLAGGAAPPRDRSGHVRRRLVRPDDRR